MHRRHLLTIVFVGFSLLDVPGVMGLRRVNAQTPQATPPAQPAAPPSPAAAPAQTPQSEIGGCRVSEMSGATQDALSKEVSGRTERVLVLTGRGAVPVQVDCDETQFFADFAEIYPDSHRIVATGNVKVGYAYQLHQRRTRRVRHAGADRNVLQRQRHGVARRARRSQHVRHSGAGRDVPGKEIHKLGPKKYKIVDGAFSTCVQPTPRWEVVSGSATINLDDYALLKNSVFRVKGVPLMYLPIFYYPIQDDDRATGFLIPTYGSSTLRGQSLSNAFFWAIARNQDATFQHDWFAKAGQAMGGEYRYILGGGSQGNARVSWLDEKSTDSGGAGRRSYQITGAMTQGLGARIRARANADYVSDVTPEQLYQQNIYRATRSTRSFGGNVTGNWSQVIVSGTFDRTDVFYPDGSYTTYGGLPRINFNEAERRIAKSPFYFGAGAEYATILRSTTDSTGVAVAGADQGLTRADFAPILRIPFTKWPFLTVNSTIGWRATYWTESLLNGQQVPDSVSRQYFELNSRITGPVFSRIFNAGATEGVKLKHVIEPVFTIRRISAIDVFDRIVKLDGSDYTVGDVWEFRYGLNNRLYAKRTASREVLSVAINQSYYTDATAAQYDQMYQSSSYAAAAASKYSALALYARTSPTDKLQGDFRTEWDPTFHTLKTLAANAGVNTAHMQASGGWSRRRYIPGLPGYDNPDFADHYLNASANFRSAGNGVGVTYSFNYDLHRDQFLQQRYLGVLQRAVLWLRRRIPGLQFRRSVHGGWSTEGSPLQYLVHARRDWNVLEPPRRVWRSDNTVAIFRKSARLET